MRNFYAVFPELKGMDVRTLYNRMLRISLKFGYQTFLGGESYGGQYIPYIGML